MQVVVLNQTHDGEGAIRMLFMKAAKDVELVFFL